MGVNVCGGAGRAREKKQRGRPPPPRGVAGASSIKLVAPAASYVLPLVQPLYCTAGFRLKSAPDIYAVSFAEAAKVRGRARKKVGERGETSLPRKNVRARAKPKTRGGCEFGAAATRA